METRKVKIEDKKPVNRKLLIWVFLITGLISGLVWWRGKVMRETWENAAANPDTGGTGVRREITPTDKPTTVKEIKAEELVKKISDRLATESGRYAVYVYHLNSGWAYGMNENERMPGASIMKVPVMVTMEKMAGDGKIDLTDLYTMEEADRSTGSGPLQFRDAGKAYSIGDLLTLLGKNSDNTAWVMFNRRVGKPAIRKTIDEMEMENTSYDDLVTTAADVTKMFQYIYEGNAGGEQGKTNIWGYLTDSIYEDRIPAGLPADISVYHKVGTDAGVWADAALVEPKAATDEAGVQKDFEPMVITILNEGVDREKATLAVPQIVKMIWDFEMKNDAS